MNLIFTWDDIKQILKSRQKQIVQLSVLCGVMTFCYFVTTPLFYEARATFKQSSGRNEQGFDLKNILQSFSSNSSEGISSSLMLSDTVLEKTVRKMGLQVEIEQEDRFFDTLFRNLLAELRYIPKDRQELRFSDVTFTSEKPYKMALKKEADNRFSLYDDKKQQLANGIVGEPVKHPLFQLTLHTLPLKEEVSFILQPVQPVINTLRKKLTIKASREDKNLLIIKYIDSNRPRSAEVVNTLMAMYEKYLIEENRLIIGSQISYLNERQNELSAKFDRDIQDHAIALQDNLKSQGFLGIKEEMEFVLEPLQLHKTRLNGVEIELNQIEQRIAKTDLTTKIGSTEPLLIERYSQLLTGQIGSAKQLLEHVHRKEKITASSLTELQPAIDEFNLALDSNEPNRSSKIEGLINDFMHHLASREKSLRESSQWIQTTQNDLSGISLDVARRQFDQYSTQFDDLHAQLKQVMFMRDHLFDPHFEISTLSNVLNDTVTQQMIQRSSELEAQLHDDMHRSLRDKDRVKTTLTTHKRFLESHLNQTLQLGKIRIDLLKEKLSSLYSVIKTLLMQEQEALKTKIAELTRSLQTLPGLWVHENRLKFKSDLTRGMMEGLVHIAETKNLAHHLYQVESRPLDIAKPPLGFIQPHLFVKSTLASFLSLIFFSILMIVQALIKGFPISLTTLKQIGVHTSGSFSPTSPLQLETIQDNDRDTLRKLISFLLDTQEPPKGIVAVLGEKQTLFFPALAALLKKYNKTSCIIDCSFGKITTQDEVPGLFQILSENSSLDAIRHFPSYDFLPVGNSSPEGVELLKSKQFEQLIQALSNQYDFIFLLSRTPPHSLEAETLFDLCTHSVVVAETPLESLQNYLNPPRQKEKRHVTFIQYA